MKTADASSGPETDETFALVFQWERRRRVHWRLVGLIAISLLLHAVGFYLFQATYTPTGSQAAPSVQVTMLPIDRPDTSPESRAHARALSRWLAVEDPSLATEPASSEAARGPGELVEYVPSYRAAPPPFKPLEAPAAGNAPPPRPRPAGPVPVATGKPVAPLVMSSAPTRVSLTAVLASLVPVALPPVTLALPAGAKLLEPTIFLVGVRADGGPAFLFREESSGVVAADVFAQDYLSRLTFQPSAAANGRVVWGWAAFRWGRDVYR